MKEKPEKQEKQRWMPFVNLHQTFTESVANAKRKALSSALMSYFEYLDEMLWKIEPGIQGQEIWGDIDQEEAETLTKVLLRTAQRSEVMATVVDMLIDWQDIAACGFILVPRGIKTWELVGLPQMKKRARRKRIA